jgi:PAS domain S-box-containing protein
MSKKPTYQALEQRIKKLEKKMAEYKRAEKIISESEELLHSLIQTVGSVLIFMTPDFQILEFNNEAEHLYGYKRHEVLGKNYLDLFIHDKKVRKAVEADIKKVLSGKPTIGFENPVRTREGTERLFLWNVTRLLDGEGQVAGVIACGQDITKRKQAEENIRFLSSVVEQSSEGMAVADLEGILLFINQAWARMHGYESTDKLIGKHLSIFHNQEQLEKDVKTFNDKVMENGFHMGEVGHIHKDGKCFMTLMTTTLLKDAQEKPFAIAGIAKDITDRKRVEKELSKYRYHLEDLVKERTTELEEANKQLLQEISERKQAEEKLTKFNSLLSSLIDSPSDVMVFSVDKDFNYTFFNSAHIKEMKKIWRVDIEIGKSLLDYIPTQKERDRIKKNLRRALKGKQLKKEEAYGEGENRFWYELAYNPIHEEKGSITGVTVFITNISDRKTTEEALCLYQKKLRSLASELSLTEERERRNIATDLHDYIGQSLSISMIKLKSFQESVSSVDLEPLKEIQTLIEQAIKDTRSLMSDLSPPMLYDLGFESAVEWLAEKISQQHGISTSFENDKHPKQLDDEVRILLFQAVRELLVNVAKHGQASNALVLVRKEGNNIRVDVIDNGIGFDTSHIGFYKNETSGFGLFNIRERLDYLGGDFEIKSMHGKGTCVTLVAPLKTNETSTDHII